MGYNYNGKLRSAEVLLHPDGSWTQIRRAETPADYFATLDHTPFGLQSPAYNKPGRTPSCLPPGRALRPAAFFLRLPLHFKDGCAKMAENTKQAENGPPCVGPREAERADGGSRSACSTWLCSRSRRLKRCSRVAGRPPLRVRGVTASRQSAPFGE